MKYFKLLILFLLLISCEKDNEETTEIELPQIYNFIRSDFIDKIQCYDTLGDKIDYVSDRFIKNDFLFGDGGIYPYEKIEIKKDSSTNLYYTIRELTSIDEAFITKYQDSILFYSANRFQNGLLFKGYIKDDQLRIPAFGYKFQMYDGNGWSGTTLFGKPDFNDLIERMLQYNYKLLLIQRFDLIYEKSN